MVSSGWRTALWMVAGVLVVSLLLAALFWIGVLLVALALVGWFNLVLLPRVALRLRIPQRVIAIALLPVLAAGGLALAGLSGAVAACSIWTIGVALPRVVLWRVRRRLWQGARGEMRLRRVRVIDQDSALRKRGREVRAVSA